MSLNASPGRAFNLDWHATVRTWSKTWQRLNTNPDRLHTSMAPNGLFGKRHPIGQGYQYAEPSYPLPLEPRILERHDCQRRLVSWLCDLPIKARQSRESDPNLSSISENERSRNEGLPAWTVDWNEDLGSNVLFKTLISFHQLIEA